MPTPNTNDRGRFRFGLRISPAVNVTLFQADCEKSGPTIAVPSATSSASPARDSPDGETAYVSNHAITCCLDNDPNPSCLCSGAYNDFGVIEICLGH